MADLAESTAKLQLDEVTGEMVSKGELKKRMKKREKAATTAKAKEAAAAAAAAAPPEDKAKAAPKPKEKAEAAVIDPDLMFKTGFLHEVFNVVKPVRPVLTRFPPEPNGFLHAGHVKSIVINFGSSRFFGGECNLRYDDTNPEAEEQVYFDAILDMVKWLGFTPARITYSSDFFQQLYDDAEKLIGLGKAYVCHCDKAALTLQRGGEKGTAGPRFRCQHADQSVEENLKKFRDMRDGHYQPREAFLRMKQGSITDGNPQMWDLVAYRVLNEPHFRTGDKWKIYPTYDFAHCLCDAYEGITHSLCTTEFVLSRTSYEWLNDTVGRTGPTQREFGRLTMAGTILSKRKILKLVQEKIVRDWNDPRLYTLIGIKRRGVPPGALLEYIQGLGGVTTSNSVMEIKRFEQSVRKYLERTVPRLMLILDPVPVVIEDADDVDGTPIDIPFHPGDPKMGSREAKFTKTVYIDRSDFREEADPSFFRLVPGKSVGLLSAPYPVKAVSFTKDEASGKVKEIRAVFDREGKKPKAYIQWVPSDARKVEVRVHNPLFKSNNPDDAPGGFLNDINPDSEIIYHDALIEAGIDEVKRRAPWPEAIGEGENGPEAVRFQGTRVGYFALDSDSTDEKMVLNRIVALKEDTGKS